RESRHLVLRFEKFPPHMGMAAHEPDVGFVLRPGGIGAVAIALEDARDGVIPEDIGDASLVAAFTPMIKDAAAGQMAGPEIAGAGAAMAGLEVADRCFVDLKVVAPPVFVADGAVNAAEPMGRKIRPIAQGPPVQRHSLAGEDLRLPVIREMV